MPNSGMAKAGNGDLLAGIIGFFLAQGIKPMNCALCGVYIHSFCGEICKRKFSETSMLPHDMISKLPEIFLKIGR